MQGALRCLNENGRKFSRLQESLTRLVVAKWSGIPNFTRAGRLDRAPVNQAMRIISAAAADVFHFGVEDGVFLADGVDILRAVDGWRRRPGRRRSCCGGQG
jgi:hypothetical protein